MTAVHMDKVLENLFILDKLMMSYKFTSCIIHFSNYVINMCMCANLLCTYAFVYILYIV